MEKPNSRGANNFVVGLFVFVACLVTSGFVVFMGGSNPFARDTSARAFFRDIRGLNVGAPVYFSGIQVGRVKGYQFPNAEEASQPGQEVGVYIVLNFFAEHRHRVQKDAVVTIATQGVLGDKVIVIRPGEKNEGEMTNGMTLASQQPSDIGDYMKKGGDLVENLGQVVSSLNGILSEISQSGKLGVIMTNLEKMSISAASASKNFDAMSKDDLQASVKSLRRVLEKVDKGQGTLGALVNDPSLHEDLRVLVGGAQRSRAVRFLIRQAISSNEPKDGKSKAKDKDKDQ